MADKAPVLTINTNSWHYRYFCAIRAYYGVSTPNRYMTSLCPYVQTMIWGSLWFVATLPCVIIGWFTLKTCRWLYRKAEDKGYTKAVDFIDQSAFGEMLSVSDHALKSYPWLHCMGWFFFAAALGAVAFGVCFVSVLICTYGFGNIHKVPGLLWDGFTSVGWYVVWAGHGLVDGIIGLGHLIWSAGETVVKAVVWLFTTAWIWLLVLRVISSLIAFAAFSFAATCICFEIGRSQAMASVLDWVMLKFNGYHEARVAAEKRREEAIEEPPAPRKPCFVERFMDSLCEKLGGVRIGVRDFFESKLVTVNGVTHKVLSTGGIVAAFLWAVKKQTCPLVKFVDDADLNPPPKPSPTPTPTPAPEPEPELSGEDDEDELRDKELELARECAGSDESPIVEVFDDQAAADDAADNWHPPTNEPPASTPEAEPPPQVEKE